MGLLPSSCRFLIRLHKRYGLEGPVLALGNPDTFGSYEDLRNQFVQENCLPAEAEIIPNTSHTWRNSAWWETKFRHYVHARTFFQMLGIKDYSAIDKFDQDQPTLLHDLNLPVPQALHHRFKLIVDGGTIEHIFNVCQVMENIFQMCDMSGWVVHFTPNLFYVDHGFYSFNPCFFYDLYSANGFDDFLCYLVQCDPQDTALPAPYFEYSYGMPLESVIDRRRLLLVYFAARKKRDVPFQIPTQRVYAEEVRQSAAAKSAIELPLYDRAIPALLKPVLDPFRPFLRTVKHAMQNLHNRWSHPIHTLDKI